jgi:hypothetical protein
MRKLSSGNFAYMRIKKTSKPFPTRMFPFEKQKKKNCNKNSKEEATWTPVIHIRKYSLSWLETGTSIKNRGVKLVLWSQTCFQYATNGNILVGNGLLVLYAN